MASCMDCNTRVPSRAPQCPVCGGRLARPERRGLAWTLGAASSVAIAMAAAPWRAWRRHRAARREERA